MPYSPLEFLFELGSEILTFRFQLFDIQLLLRDHYGAVDTLGTEEWRRSGMAYVTVDPSLRVRHRLSFARRQSRTKMDALNCPSHYHVSASCRTNGDAV